MKFIKKLLLVLSVFMISTGTLHYHVEAETMNNSLEDMNTIKSRLKAYYLKLDTIDDGAKVETILVSKAKEYLELAQDDGSFIDVDYTATDNAANGRPWSPYLAVDRMQ